MSGDRVFAWLPLWEGSESGLVLCFGPMHAAVDGFLGTSPESRAISLNRREHLIERHSASVHVSASRMFAGAWPAASLHISMRPFAVTLPMTRRPLAPLR